MTFDRDRERRNDDVYAEHKAALARGEKRVLRRTDTGELHSYPGDEIGFSPGRGQVQVRSWWGMGIVSAFLGLLFLGSSVMFLASFGQGADPEWGALFAIVLGGFGAWYTFGLARDEHRATQLRKERGAPEPGAGHVSQ
ncbi:hypothetical protein CXX84_02685 [Arthrobacter sp. AFG7.2]|jgi:hypothetical protein|uniref:hypothetical protein n=1 Tax=Arthrobacter sp. AFG7.2 TaxID=1688693 RepID=UPI000C9DF040|nr:hypothetical protein [Arthrobacter sp. AFG7.2]PNI10390.1 hypothetical protein CXX84_02685 [Arthrobacter sp. AFG7.2]